MKSDTNTAFKGAVISFVFESHFPYFCPRNRSS